MLVLFASAGVMGSCISQLGDMRADDDGGVRRGELAAPTGATRETSGFDEGRDPDVSMVTSSSGGSREAPTAAAPSLDGGQSSAEPTGSASDLAGFSDRATDGGGPSGPAGSPPAESTGTASGCALGTAKSEQGGDTCVACEAGGHCPGAEAPFAACESGTYDADLDAKTPCVAKQWCPAGSYVVSEGDRVTDRTCADCPEGEYAPMPNATRCEPWSSCAAPTHFELEPPSTSNDRRCQPCPPLTVTLEDNAVACTALAYVMTAGQVAFEAEHPHVVTNTGSDVWSLLNMPAVSGGQCVEVGPDDRSAWTTDPFVTAPRLDYLVHFDAAATYYIHVRGDAGANSEGLSDSCYAALDGVVTEWYRFEVVGGTWGWASKPVVVDSVGLHVVSVLAREDGFRVDKIVVNRSQTPPTGAGPDESPTAPVVE